MPRRVIDTACSVLLKEYCRWHNHLNPNIKKEAWTKEEDNIVISSHQKIGSRWSEIAKLLPGRTDNAIKNRWNSTMRRVARQLAQKQSPQQQQALKTGGKTRRHKQSAVSDNLSFDQEGNSLYSYCLSVIERNPDSVVSLPPGRGQKRTRGEQGDDSAKEGYTSKNVLSTLTKESRKRKNTTKLSTLSAISSGHSAAIDFMLLHRSDAPKRTPAEWDSLFVHDKAVDENHQSQERYQAPTAFQLKLDADSNGSKDTRPSTLAPAHINSAFDASHEIDKSAAVSSSIRGDVEALFNKFCFNLQPNPRSIDIVHSGTSLSEWIEALGQRQQHQQQQMPGRMLSATIPLPGLPGRAYSAPPMVLGMPSERMSTPLRTTSVGTGGYNRTDSADSFLLSRPKPSTLVSSSMPRTNSMKELANATLSGNEDPVNGSKSNSGRSRKAKRFDFGPAALKRAGIESRSLSCASGSSVGHISSDQRTSSAPAAACTPLFPNSPASENVEAVMAIDILPQRVHSPSSFLA